MTGYLLPSQYLLDFYVIPSNFDNQVPAALVDVIFGTVVNPPEQSVIEMLCNRDETLDDVHAQFAGAFGVAITRAKATAISS